MTSRLCSLCLLLALFQQVPGQTPPWTPNPNASAHPAEPAHRFPIDQPQQVPERRNQPPIDLARLKHDADELAKLAVQIPSSVEQASKGVLSKDLSDRLKRIEKLSKQLRRELYR